MSIEITNRYYQKWHWKLIRTFMLRINSIRKSFHNFLWEKKVGESKNRIFCLKGNDNGHEGHEWIQVIKEEDCDNKHLIAFHFFWAKDVFTIIICSLEMCFFVSGFFVSRYFDRKTILIHIYLKRFYYYFFFLIW